MIVVPVANSTFANGLYFTPIDYSHRKIVLLEVLSTIQNPGFVEITCTERKLPLTTFFSCGENSKLLCALLSIK